MRIIAILALLTALISAPAPVAAGQEESNRWTFCYITCGKKKEPTREELERKAEADKRAAEARALSAQREADYAKRRQAILDANRLSAHRQAEAERLARMKYDAMIAKNRAMGCWVPGDPLNPKRKSCATQE